ncbi:hypothetical protein [Amycolatopsis azurea]|uniref:hypothetical protein n=1 Tax=Amycolatopsis azurea TaxID=36819 RepID=UPI001FE769D2|nr:hypothetical protein [Amycolatopsis azurea]
MDLTVVALLVAIRRLSEHGAAPEVQCSARRLLVLASAVTLVLNVVEPLITGEVGKALFDAVGPLLLIGWSEVGPGLLQALADLRQSVEPPADSVPLTAMAECESEMSNVVDTGLDGDLVERAKYMDARHRELRQRPISAEGLHKALGVGAERSRSLTAPGPVGMARSVGCELGVRFVAELGMVCPAMLRGTVAPARPPPEALGVDSLLQRVDDQTRPVDDHLAHQLGVHVRMVLSALVVVEQLEEELPARRHPLGGHVGNLVDSWPRVT